MRIARIARPGELYGAPESAQTCEAIDESIVNPRHFGEVIDVSVSKSIDMGDYSQMPGLGLRQEF